MKLLSEKIAIVTGGTRGIGKAIARSFVDHGASVAILGTNAEKGKEVLQELQTMCQGDQKVAFYQTNVAQSSEVEKTLAQIYTDFGRVDILVNNAGITRDNLLMRLTEEDWEAVLNTNLKSVFNICRFVVRPMMKARQGKIINITSVVGLVGNAGQTNYAASKAGMIGFTKSLAKELGSRGICVNCIAPGFIETDMTEGLNEKQKEALLGQIPLQKMGSAQDIASAALYLASADYVTGQVLVVDGGMTM